MTSDIADARRLADMHALYRMFDDRGHLLYIGITGDLGKRLGNHSFKRWFPLVERITLEWLPNRAAALVAEKRAISTEHPRYNQAGIQAPKKARPAAVKKPEPPPEDRDLIADLDRMLGSQPVPLSVLARRLRLIAPDWEPYKKITGVQLRDMLTRRGVRTTNTANTPRLDPADLKTADV